MAHSTKPSKKKRKRSEKLHERQRQARDATAEGSQAMNPNSPPEGQTAAIREVTAEMMDEVARDAARLADGVAHHTIPHDDHPAAALHVSLADESEAALPAPEPVATQEPTRDIVETPHVPDGAPRSEAAAGVDVGGQSGPSDAIHEVAAERSNATREAAERGSETGGAVTESYGAILSDASETVEGSMAATADAGSAAVDHALDAAQGMATRSVENAAASFEAAAGATAAEMGRKPETSPMPFGSIQDYNAKLLDIIQDNFTATGALFSALLEAKTLPEAMAVNVDHMTRQIQSLTGQSRELATLAQRLAFDSLRPLKGAVRRDD